MQAGAREVDTRAERGKEARAAEKRPPGWIGQEESRGRRRSSPPRAASLEPTRHSLLRRIAFVFAGAVAITALALALSAYLVTSAASERGALDKALGQARFNLFLAESLLPPDPQEKDFENLLSALEIRGDFATLVQAGGKTYVSGPDITPALVTPELAAKVGEGRIGYQTIRVSGRPVLVVGALAGSPGLSFYFFFPQSERLADLARLRDVVVVSGVVLALIGAVAGLLIARSLVKPIRRTALAAARMAQGDLDIRLPASSDEFGALASSFNRMAENLQARMSELEAGQARERRFVADVTHELRTPLAALVGEVSLLKTRLDAKPEAAEAQLSSSDIPHLVEMVDRDVRRLRQLVDDLLEISRLDARAAEVTLETVEVGAFLRQLVQAHGWQKEVEVRVQPPPSLPTRAAEPPDPTIFQTEQAEPFAQVDRRRLERILVNLVENALIHGAPPVTLEIVHVPSSSPAGPAQVRIEVRDRGPGIPPEHLPHIFERFYKADPSRASSRGSGLGLAIARENARLLGGDLVAANLPEGGACFTLWIPAEL